MREQQEVAEQDDDHGVTPRAHLHQLERHEEDEQGDARIAPEQGMELPADTCRSTPITTSASKPRAGSAALE